MAAHKFNWSLRALGRSKSSAKETFSDTNKETNEADEWSSLASAEGTGPAPVSGSVGKNRPYWLSELDSPYGAADEDGTLKALDSVNWSRVPRLKKRSKQGFVPVTSRSPNKRPVPVTTTRWQGNGKQATNQRVSSGQEGRRAGSTWTLQFVAAITLALVGIYAHQSSTQAATAVKGIYTDAFTTDYTQQAVPVISRFLESHNMAVPAFLSQSGTLSLHVPLSGKIISDYSPTQPQMAIEGTANEPVLAAGAGTVSRVVSLQSGFMVVINHGTIGSSYYFGLKNASVKSGEAVESGQPIGALPGTANPKLMFELEQGGKAVNPHDYIVFPGSANGS